MDAGEAELVDERAAEARIAPEYLPYLEDLNRHERELFQREFDAKRKSVGMAYFLLIVVVGVWGAHRFYLREYRWGAAYIVLAFTGISVFLAVADLFLTKGRVESYNLDLCHDISLRLKSLRMEEAADQVEAED